MRAVVAAVVAIALLTIPVSLRAWGTEVHKLITRRALDGLPATLKPFFDVQKDFIVEHSADPDLWRVIGLKGDLGDETPNHQVDLEDLDDPPFKNIPHDWNAAVEKYGLARLNGAGRLPWRAQEMFDRLVTLFGDVGKPTAPYAADNTRFVASVLAHYVEDAHVPFHATKDYDGQSTNQRGIHARFETELIQRNVTSLSLAPVTVRPIASVRDFMFDTLVDSQALVADVLRADRQATEGREFYDDAYYTAFRRGAGPIVEKRMSEAASAVASAIVSAWEKAGRPALPLPGPRPPARIRR